MSSHPVFPRRNARPPATIDLPALVRLARRELPLLVAIDFAVMLAVSVCAVTAVTVTFATPLVAAVCFGPVWLAATALCLQILNDETPGLREFGAAIVHCAIPGIGLAIVPAVVAFILLGSLELLAVRPEQRWMLVPVCVDAFFLVMLAFAASTVFALTIMRDLRGRQRWLTALALAGRYPVASCGLLAGAVLILLSMRWLGPSVAIIASGPYCLLTTALARQTIDTTVPQTGRQLWDQPHASERE